MVPAALGDVDKIEPVFCGGEMDHAEEAVGYLVIAGSDGAVDLQMAEHALDVVALFVERPVVFDLHAPVCAAGGGEIDVPLRKVSADGAGIVAVVGKQGIRRALRQDDQGVTRFAICRLAAGQVQGERSPEGDSQAVSLLVNPPREWPRAR